MKINNGRLKFFLLLIILILSVVIYKTWEDKNPRTKVNNDKVLKTPDVNSDNLIVSFVSEIIVDTNKNDIFENESDDVISINDLKNTYGIEVKLEIFDSNNNGLLDLGELTPVSLVLKNNSETKYLIQSITLEGNSQIFDDGSFFGLTSNNAEGYEFSFNKLNLEYNPDNVLVLAPGKEITFDFQIKWPIKDTGGNLVPNKSFPYLKTSFIATPESGEAIYFSINYQQIKFNES